MGGIANVVSGIQQGLKAFGGVMDAIGQFVPQFKQIGDMMNKAADAFSVMSKMGEKAESEEAGKDATKASIAAPKVPPAAPAPSTLAEAGYNNVQEVQAHRSALDNVLANIKAGKVDAASMLGALGK
ncbi:MAG: hypothetical protein VKP57_03080 [Candidatus Sericytochromatia bacterium]|nr:hypothetical protein [Candidatus Sericytochromatia bacterium]